MAHGPIEIWVGAAGFSFMDGSTDVKGLLILIGRVLSSKALGIVAIQSSASALLAAKRLTDGNFERYFLHIVHHFAMEND